MMTLNTEIRNAFNQNAHCYEKAAVAQNEIGARLFERLSYFKITPKRILDLGSGTGIFTQRLKALYPKAEVIGLDLAFAMLVESQKKKSWYSRSRWSLINANMYALPFKEDAFDLVFSNQVIHWSQPLARMLKEVHRVLNIHGCFMFSTLGPDTFQELHQAFAQVDKFAHTNTFLDMHDIGDSMQAAQFLDPVVDMEKLTLHYGDIRKLVLSLKAQGVRNINAARNPGLTGRGRWQAFENAYQSYRTAEGKYPLTYEVIYGHAWKGEPPQPSTNNETRILVSDIRRKAENKE